MQKIQLPSGKEAEIVDYVEAGVLLDLPKQEDQTQFLLETLVISLEGSKEDVLARIRKLTIKDYKAIDEKLLSLMDSETESLKV